MRPLTVAAMATSAVMMTYQVASRAVRDALFLTNFHVHSLPAMVAGSALLSIVVALLATRATAAYGPARAIPVAFLVSALLTLAEWGLTLRRPDLGAIAVYLHVAALGPVLISGFWSIVNERYDPRSARRRLGRIAAVGTLGGLAGGVLAERLTAWTGVASTLPALALAHGWCAWSTYRMPTPIAPPAEPAAARAALPTAEALRRLLVTPYLRNLALLVFGSAASVALLDYVFKAQAAGVARQGLDLVRLFSAFYAIVGVLTFVAQTLLTRRALERVGLARSIGALHGGLIVGGMASALLPGPWTVGLARGLEGVLRGSLFRTSYEMFYTPIPAAEKRATKTLVDVGCERLGDVTGAGLTALVLLMVPMISQPVLLALAVLTALATLGIVARLQRGYVDSLEAGLRAGAVRLDLAAVEDQTTRTSVLRVLGSGGAAASPYLTARRPETRGGEPARAREPLVDGAPLDAAGVAHAIALLAQPEAAPAVVAALNRVASRHTGQLVDALLDPASAFDVRRRIPGVLADCATPRAVDGLVRGLADTRFEVRYRCGAALARMLERAPALSVDPEAIFRVVRDEAVVERRLWDSHRELEGLEERGEGGAVDEFLRRRAGRSLEHVFTLLTLVLPREPLRIAFRGLFADDLLLRGTALEYLESVLPAAVREVLWPHLEPERATRRRATEPARDREQVLDDLMRSHHSIQLDLEALRRRPPAEPR